MSDLLGLFGRTQEEIKQVKTFDNALQAYISAAGTVFIDIMRNRIDEKKANSSFALRQGLASQEVKTNDGYSLEFSSDVEYWEKRDQGVSGWEKARNTEFQFKNKRPSTTMVNSIADWLRNKNLTANEWAVATNILRYGYDGINYIDAAFNNANLDIFNNQLAQAMELAVVNSIERVIPEMK